MNLKKYIHTIFETLNEYQCLDVRVQEIQQESPIPFALPLTLLTKSKLKSLRKEGFSCSIGIDLMRKVNQLSSKLHKNKAVVIFDEPPFLISQAIWQHFQATHTLYIYKGGTKALLQECNTIFQKEYSFFTLYGETGVGKSELLKLLEKDGQQVLDFEKIAKHKGSSFGNLKNMKQPSQDSFVWTLAYTLSQFSTQRPIFTESEKASLGQNMVPLYLSEALEKGKKIRITLDHDRRVKRLVQEYANINDLEIKKALEKLKFKIGTKESRELIKKLESKNYHFIAENLLSFFDQSNSYQAISEERFDLIVSNENPIATSKKIIQKIA